VASGDVKKGANCRNCASGKQIGRTEWKTHLKESQGLEEKTEDLMRFHTTFQANGNWGISSNKEAASIEFYAISAPKQPAGQLQTKKEQQAKQIRGSLQLSQTRPSQSNSAASGGNRKPKKRSPSIS